MVNYKILIPNFSDTANIGSKTSFFKKVDFRMKFSYGVCFLKLFLYFSDFVATLERKKCLNLKLNHPSRKLPRSTFTDIKLGISLKRSASSLILFSKSSDLLQGSLNNFGYKENGEFYSKLVKLLVKLSNVWMVALTCMNGVFTILTFFSVFSKENRSKYHIYLF